MDGSLCNEGVPKRNIAIGSLDWWGIDLIQIKLQLSLPEYTEGLVGNQCPWITLNVQKPTGTEWRVF